MKCPALALESPVVRQIDAMPPLRWGISENPVAPRRFQAVRRGYSCLWQAAIEAVILVATSSGGPTMMARIGVMRALNRHVERVFDSSRKEKHWGTRKLARDR